MRKPFVSRIPDFMSRPFINDYCDRWKIPYDKDVDYAYGNSVLWMGAFYKESLRAVCGLFVSDTLPGELFVYGFYGDGSKSQAPALRALIELIVQLPYNYKYGYIVSDNLSMLRTIRRYGWDVEQEGMLPDGHPVVKAGIHS